MILALLILFLLDSNGDGKMLISCNHTPGRHIYITVQVVLSLLFNSTCEEQLHAAGCSSTWQLIDNFPHPSPERLSSEANTCVLAS